MELVDRYIYAVTRRLPEKQRDDIGRELRSNIEDMIEQHDGSASDETVVKNVLSELGDPALIADNYRESARYLIGPNNYDNYILILKIVAASIILGISVSTIVISVFPIERDLIKIITGYFSTLFSALIQGFTWVTIIFAIFEHHGVKFDEKYKKNHVWNVDNLPKIPVKEALIPRHKSIVSIIVCTLLIIIICIAPQLFAIYIKNGSNEHLVISIFNLDILNRYRILIVALIMLEIFREILKLIAGGWTLRLSIILILGDLISIALFLIVFINPNLWNAGFGSELARIFNITSNFPNPLYTLRNAFIVIILIPMIIEIVSTLNKGYKYNVVK